MSTIEKSIEVNVPVSTAYNQWTQFEDFPKFMEGVKEVKQLDDKRLHWRAEIAGKDKRIAWRSRTGAPNAGVVTFHQISPTTTRIMLQLEYDPETVVEKAGDWIGIVSRRVERDLQRFKEFIESRGQETGAWRGEIQGGDVRKTG